MGITASTLIRTSMQDLGVLGAGESAEGSHVADGLRRLQVMVGSWSLDPLTAVRVQGETFPTISGKASYTIGPGLEFNTTRPVGQQSIVAAALLLNQGQPTQVEIPVGVMTNDQYAGLRNKALRSPMFTHVIYVPGATAQGPTPPPPPGTNTFGSGVIILWPVPTDANPLRLYIEHTLPMFDNLTTSYPVPDGVAAAIQHNLTMALAPMFQVEPPAYVVMMAARTFASMKRNNYQFTDVALDPMFTFGSGAGYDINTGGTTRHG